MHCEQLKKRLLLFTCWKEIFGYENHELGDRIETWFSLIHPEDATTVMNVLQTDLQQKSNSCMVECRLRCQDGSYKWILS